MNKYEFETELVLSKEEAEALFDLLSNDSMLFYALERRITPAASVCAFDFGPDERRVRRCLARRGYRGRRGARPIDLKRLPVANVTEDGLFEVFQ